MSHQHTGGQVCRRTLCLVPAAARLQRSSANSASRAASAAVSMASRCSASSSLCAACTPQSGDGVPAAHSGAYIWYEPSRQLQGLSASPVFRKLASAFYCAVDELQVYQMNTWRWTQTSSTALLTASDASDGLPLGSSVAPVAIPVAAGCV